MTRSNKRALILEAADHIVATTGAAHLTIDAVAAAAGVSKGGVLYHFPTKQALLEGMLARLLEQVDERTTALREQQPAGTNAAVVARIIEQHDQQPAERAMSRAILAAAAEDPDLLGPARAAVRQAFDEAAGGSSPPELGWVLLLAVEGLRFFEMLDLLPMSEVERDRIHRLLLELARGPT